jgi:putative ABC transport system substrate-binding protein
MPVVGFLHSGSKEENGKRLALYLKGLAEAGFVDGKNVTIEYRWAEDNYERLPALAADLEKRHVAAIATPGSTPASVAAKAATSKTPIVFAVGSDPVALGLITSLGRPGGNATGGCLLSADVASKQLGLMRELAPHAERYFALTNPASPLTAPFVDQLDAGAAKIGLHVEMLRASKEADIDDAFAAIPKGLGSALIMAPDTFLYSNRRRIVSLANGRGVPALFPNREFADLGGLASYGADFSEILKVAGGYTARILKGAKPADLPVAQSSKFEFVLNLKTAKTIGLTVPEKILSIADDVVE